MFLDCSHGRIMKISTWRWCDSIYDGEINCPYKGMTASFLHFIAVMYPSKLAFSSWNIKIVPRIIIRRWSKRKKQSKIFYYKKFVKSKIFFISYDFLKRNAHTNCKIVRILKWPLMVFNGPQVVNNDP